MRFPRYFQEISFNKFVNGCFNNNGHSPQGLFLLDSGSSAIRFILEFLSKEKNRQLNVGIPVYACFSVYSSVYSSGNIPFLLDFDPLVPQHINSAVLKDLDVLIWIDYFGYNYQNKLSKLKNDFPALIIIEDATHVDYNNYRINNNPISDFAVFSFNFRKPIVAGGGGAFIVNNIEYTPKITVDYNLLKSEKIKWNKLLKIFIYNYAYNILIYQLFYSILNKKREAYIPSFRITQKPQKISAFNNKILIFRENNTNKLEIITNNYIIHFGSYCTSTNYFGYLCYFPILFKSVEERDSKLKILLNNGIDAFILWENLYLNYKTINIEINNVSYPTAINFFNRVLFLPNTILETNKRIAFLKKCIDLL